MRLLNGHPMSLQAVLAKQRAEQARAAVESAVALAAAKRARARLLWNRVSNSATIAVSTGAWSPPPRALPPRLNELEEAVRDAALLAAELRALEDTQHGVVSARQGLHASPTEDPSAADVARAAKKNRAQMRWRSVGETARVAAATGAWVPAHYSSRCGQEQPPPPGRSLLEQTLYEAEQLAMELRELEESQHSSPWTGTGGAVPAADQRPSLQKRALAPPGVWRPPESREPLASSASCLAGTRV